LAAGRVAIFRNFDELGFTAAGELTFQGEVIDAILLGDALYMGIPNALLNRLITAYLREQLIFPDSPFHAVLSDKGLLAVAHECRSENLLDASDSAIIARYIPWTGWLRDDEVLLEGVRVKLVPHLLAHKDDFVIKKFDSSSGRHVVVGRYVSSETWERAVRANVEARWIVQQHCAPGTLDVHDAELGVVPHALIWGVCGYGAEYGGAFIRAARIGRHSVINSATGATELQVFEVE
jgi:hypothetical protein